MPLAARQLSEGQGKPAGVRQQLEMLLVKEEGRRHHALRRVDLLSRKHPEAVWDLGGESPRACF